MAKWGEGDPRWIVEDRPDGTNVNNWHWKEKDATAWSKDKLTNLLSDLKFGDTAGNALEVEEVNFGDECEAVINNRKQKLIFLYEFNITLKCSGYTFENDKVTGNIEIPNLEQQEPIEDVDIDFSQETPKSVEPKYYDFFKTQVRPFIRERLQTYVDMLTSEYSKGIVLPTKDVNSKAEQKGKVTKQTADKEVSQRSDSKGGANTGLKIATFKIELKETFQATAHDILEAFLDKPRVEAFTGAAAQVDRSKGGAFALYGRNVTGYFDSIEDKRIKMRWRKSSWPAEHYSLVDITLHEVEERSETEMKLIQTLIPSDYAEEQEMRAGWTNMYFQPMKQRLALGYLL
ncbi:activator of 90 kDa heat shock protein ATPase homolog 1-like [Convolutriloba macropyga]|uniref:activator of 90 kDa heat shock protein ATPase homolog 1-like n=1 Tax=Convolutriloba macropyga TaxID=536237 RepID=UPI003F52429C